MNSRPSPDVSPTKRLIAAIQELSLARDLPRIMEIVRGVARRLTGADGATFVLREGDNCHCADEDAIAPLWKGKRFPLSACVSGWVMTHRQAAVIEDIHEDPRIPAEEYRPTFVRSLAMVPIRKEAPIAAIGNYWARPHRPTEEELELLQALADSVGVAMENVKVYAELENRVRLRTRELENANQELESFAYSVSHDLQSPLRAMLGYAGMIREDFGDRLPEGVLEYLERLKEAGDRMGVLIRDILKLARLPNGQVAKEEVDLSALAREVAERLASERGGKKPRVDIRPGAVARGDPGMLRIVLENLFGNAWKFTARTREPRIEFGFVDGPSGREFFVRDNGAGFDERHAARLFKPFQRLHAQGEFSGSGVGLATVRRVVVKHGGEVRAVGRVNEGATFYFTLPD
jgi:Bacteriophytochrome (light-regulated signal transduction histidine kinase)